MGKTKKPNRYNIAQPKRASGGSGASGLGSLTNFTNAQDIKNRFWVNAAARRQVGDKAHGDAGYWVDGKCNWGGNHYLQKDCETLAQWANNVVSTESDAQELTLAINEQEFNNKKQQLVNKLQDCINKCQVSNAWSIGNVCCIWNDYFGSFVGPFTNQLKQKLQDELNKLRAINPVHQREIIEIEAEIRKAEAERNDAMTKAATETDPAEKAQFIATAQAAERTIKQAKTRLTKNPLSKLAQYSYINDMGRLFGGNISNKSVNLPGANPIPDPNNSGGVTGGGGNNPTGGQTPWVPWGGSGFGSNNSQQSNQQQLLILAGIAILVTFYLMNQKDNSYD